MFEHAPKRSKPCARLFYLKLGIQRVAFSHVQLFLTTLAGYPKYRSEVIRGVFDAFLKCCLEKFVLRSLNTSP